MVCPEPQPGCVSVTFDSSAIRLYQPDGQSGTMSWDNLGSVTVAITGEVDCCDDVFWLLLSRDRSQYLAVPISAVGERELLMAMQIRLSNFDNDAVITAMTSTETEHYTVWEAPLPH